MRRRPSFGGSRSQRSSGVFVESFYQKPGQLTPAPPPVGPASSAATASSSTVVADCAECRWRAIQEQLQTTPGALQHDRLFPARSIPMMVADAASGLLASADDATTASTAIDDEQQSADDDLYTQLEPDDLWDELGSADPPRVVYATSTAALTVVADSAGKIASAVAAATAVSPTSPREDPLQSPAAGSSSAAAKSSSSAHSASESVADTASMSGTTATSSGNATGTTVARSGVVVHAASLNRLIQLLTPEHGRPDYNFNAAFFMTYPRFTTTATVVRKLVHRFLFVPATAPPPHRVLIRVGVLRAMAMLLGADPRDLSPADAKRIALFAREARAAGYQDDVDALEAAARTQQRSLSYSLPSPQVHSLGISFPVKFHELGDVGLVRLHQQFCLVEYSTYDSIEPRELLVNWESPRTAHFAPNLRAMVRRFNAITNWTTSLILQAPTSETRTTVVEMLVQLADYMRQSNNFHVLNAILAGVSKSLVASIVTSALAKRPDRRAKLVELQTLMESGNWTKLMKTCNPPLIPFLGKFQSDLVHIDDSMRDLQQDGQVVFTKQMLLHRTISELLRGKGCPYLVKIEPCLHFYVQTLPERLPDEQLDAIAPKPRASRTASMRTISTESFR